MGMRSSHKAGREVLKKQLRDMYFDQTYAEEREWEKVMAVLRNNPGKYLTSSEISAAANTELSVPEIRANMLYNEKKSSSSTDGWNHSHSNVLRNAVDNLGINRLTKSRKTTTRKFVEVDENNNIIPGSVIERTRSQVAFAYHPGRRG